MDEHGLGLERFGIRDEPFDEGIRRRQRPRPLSGKCGMPTKRLERLSLDFTLGIHSRNFRTNIAQMLASDDVRTVKRALDPEEYEYLVFFN